MILGYTQIEDVINEAGLEGDLIDIQRLARTQIQLAEGIMNGTIGNIYSLPLGFRFRNSVEFTGTGTGNGTLTITINAVSYTVAVVDELSASKAADLFRQAIIDSGEKTLVADPVTDLPGNETVVFCGVSLVSATSLTQVDITNVPGTVAGITATEATNKVKAFPSLVEGMTRQLAAAFLLKESFGKNAQDSNNDGQAKAEMALDMLAQINDGTLKIFDDLGGTELPKDSSTLPQFNPTKANTDSDSGTDDHTPRNFIYDDQF